MIPAWKPPIDPAEVTKECAEVLKPYRIRPSPTMHTVAKRPREQFRKHNIQYNISELTVRS
jgi:hypothetical protein